MRLYVIQVWNVFINISPMDPQVKIDPNHNNNELKPDKIIAMMRVTKKTDPLFKPLKKLKNALDSIGYENISLLPTRVVIVFHFGLGNELDFQFIRKTHPPQYCIKNSPILPGKSYCYLTFTTAAEAEEYLNTKYAPILQGVPAAYTELGYENLSRVMISMFNKQQKTNISQQMLDIENAPLHYEPGKIPGLVLVQQFITKEEELELLETIDKAQWSKLNNRRVQHYGYQFKYGRNQIDRDEKFQKPMPDFIQKILARLEKLDFLPGYRFDQMTINDYFSGDGIPAHFDTHSPFQEHFVAISLLSGLVMQWRKYDGTQQQVYLHPRSLIVFAGEGRYAWTHAIACRKVDKVGGQLKHRSRRISITLRKIKFTQCKCPYYFYCDSQGYDQKTMKKNNPLLLKYLAQNVNTSKLGNKSSEQIYKTYVLDAYKGFGFDFHNKSIGLVQKFMDQEFNNEQNKNLGLINILDVGCGNGEYLDVIEKAQYKTNYHYIGIQICQTMKPFDNKIIMDGRSLCFREGSFDLVLCVAVLHHLTSVEQRIQMLKELNRVTTESGTIIISVFGHEQKSNVYKDQDILLDYCVPQFKAKKEINPKEQEIQPRIQKRGIVYQRYYHLFKEDQIRQLCGSANLQISKLQTDKQNIILVCNKAKDN